MKKIEIDFFDNNEHIQEKDEELIIRLTEFPDDLFGKIEQEFIEKDDKPGEFEEFVFKEFEEDI